MRATPENEIVILGVIVDSSEVQMKENKGIRPLTNYKIDNPTCVLNDALKPLNEAASRLLFDGLASSRLLDDALKPLNEAASRLSGDSWWVDYFAKTKAS